MFLKLSQFDLNLLPTLDALLSEQNVTHAGIRIHLSQSATSAALARLRSYFQDPLLVPIGGKLILTPLAEELRKPVRNLLLQAETTIATRANFDPLTSRRHFTIGMSDYAAGLFMADTLRNFQKEAPHVTFEIVPTGEIAAAALEAGTLDFLIRPEAFASTIHPRKPLLIDTHSVIAWNQNPLVKRKLSLQKYLHIGHIIVRINQGAGPNFDELSLRRLKYKRKIEVIAHSFNVVPHMIVGSNRIATIPTRLAKKYADVLPLKLMALPVEIPPLVQVLQWHKYHDLDPAYVWLRRRLFEFAAKSV